MLCINKVYLFYTTLCMVHHVANSFQSFSSQFTRSSGRKLPLAVTQPVGDGIEPIFDQSSVPEISSNINTDDDVGNVNIPSTGVSISDEIEAAQKDKFVTEIVPINGLAAGVAAQLVTMSMFTGSFEPVRYVIALSQPSIPVQNITAGNDDEDFMNKKQERSNITDYVMVDIPPYSNKLVEQINEYLALYNGKLRMIISTNRNSIHYDEAPAIYSTRRADLSLWCKAFPDLKIVAYRLDIPRDCRYAVTQVLDGYGPFALNENNVDNTFQFDETSRPLTVVEWDHSVTVDAFSGGAVPDDFSKETDTSINNDWYSPSAIRDRENGKRILAIYTPGYTFGSVSYVFPESGLCCSGFALPVEDNRYDDNDGIGGSTGPALDCRGYISNSKNRKRHMESAENLIDNYIDRFNVILPARGDPLFLEDDIAARKKHLIETISQYEKISNIYESLGIISSIDN